MALPATDEDFFDDDEGRWFEPYSNRVAAAGLIDGCGTRRFCGGSSVTRAVAAVTIARALELPESTTDHYTDDNGSAAEPAINAVADAGSDPALWRGSVLSHDDRHPGPDGRATCGARSRRPASRAGWSGVTSAHRPL